MSHGFLRGARVARSIAAVAVAAGLALAAAPNLGAGPAPLATHPAAGQPAAAAGAPPLIAFSIHPSGTVEQLIPEFLALKAMGATAIRTDFQWTHIQPGGFGTAFNWTQNDADVQAAEATGLQVDAVLDYSNPLYSAAGAANGGNSDYPPDDPETFARFAAEVAQHYQDRIARYEVWNEENLGFRFWLPQADPAAYGALLCDTYRQLKHTSPRVPVMSGGVFKEPVGDFTGILIGGSDFLDQMLTSIGNQRCFDAVAYHPYPYPHTSPEAIVPGPGSTSAATYPAKLRAVLDKHHVPPSIPLWDTEIGWPTNPTDNGVTEQIQAEYTLRTNLLAWAKGVPLITWYDQYDASDADTNTNQEEHFGFFHFDETPKPVVSAMETYNKIFGRGGWRFTADVSSELGLPGGNQGVDEGFALEFTGPNSQHALALWYANENVPPGCSTGVTVIDCPVMPTLPAPATIPVTLNLPANAQLTTMTGTTAEPATTQLQVGQAPIYLTWQGAPLPTAP